MARHSPRCVRLRTGSLFTMSLRCHRHIAEHSEHHTRRARCRLSVMFSVVVGCIFKGVLSEAPNGVVGQRSWRREGRSLRKHIVTHIYVFAVSLEAANDAFPSPFCFLLSEVPSSYYDLAFCSTLLSFHTPPGGLARRRSYDGRRVLPKILSAAEVLARRENAGRRFFLSLEQSR